MWRLLLIRLDASVIVSGLRGADVASASRTPLGRGVSDDGGTCAIGSAIGGASGSSRRGAFGNIHTHIRRGGWGQRLYAWVTASSAQSGLEKTLMSDDTKETAVW